MSVFDKFNNFKMDAEKQISSEDKEQLERFQEIYESTLLYYKKVRDLYKEEQKKYTEKDSQYISSYFSMRASDLGVIDTVKKLQTSFPLIIYSYFSNKYKVDLDDRDKSDKFNKIHTYSPSEDEINELFEKRHYKPILDDIIGQLGGMTFNDVSIQQIKDKMKNACSYGRGGNWHIEVKNAIVKYKGWTGVNQWREEFSIRINDFLEILPSVLGLMEFGDSKMGFSRLRQYYDMKIDYDEMKNGIEFPECEKIALIKFFQNGNINLKFKKPEYAREFVSDYCGYSL